ncbi:MAG: glycosyltransferase [Planctomycetota bacterium]|nr:glycosyltransferase [Planctomycetota bacterium]
MTADDRKLSALVVNYETGAFAERCVESLLREWSREGRDADRLEIVVVDNASPTDQGPHLERIGSLGATVVRSPENLGYAGGMNLALSRTDGGPLDVVAVLNPDLHFLPGSVRVLMDYLAEHPECGVVAPRATIDPGGVIHLPKNALATLAEELRAFGARISPLLCRAYSRRRLRAAIPWWTASEPLVTDMLSGCCLFLRRDVIAELPALMDERFPLYYEDTDLFRTLHRLGHTVVQHTGASILHHWSRSSGIGESFAGEPQRRYAESRRAYYRKHYGPLGLSVVQALDWLSERWPKRAMHRPMHRLEPLGALAEPIELRLPRRCRFLVEIAMHPDWLLAAGILGEGDRWTCPPAAWEWFFRGDYFARALDLDTHAVLGAWSFQKTTAGRDRPVDSEELDSSPEPALRQAAP